MHRVVKNRILNNNVLAEVESDGLVVNNTKS